MNSFYEKIVGITENTAYRSVLIKHNDELYNMLTNGYEENIKISAQNGYSKSIIALFNVNTIYRGKISILDMLFPTEKFVRKCRKYGVEPVLERIKVSLQPFEVKYEVLNDYDKKKNHVAAIIVHWKIPKDSDSDESADPVDPGNQQESDDSEDSGDFADPGNPGNPRDLDMDAE